MRRAVQGLAILALLASSEAFHGGNMAAARLRLRAVPSTCKPLPIMLSPKSVTNILDME